MLPRTFWLGCRLAPLGAVLAGCSLLWPESETAVPSADASADRTAEVVAPSEAAPPPLPIIFFSADGDELDIGAREKIEMIATIAKDPRWIDRPILVTGHSDAQGEPEYNQSLASRRAELVAGELIFADVARDRVIVRSVGAEEPLAPNLNADGSDNPQGRALNRRVEVRLLVLPDGAEQ
ncbi:MAG: OmpA family protein [Gammaproteobacteria bacterium]